MSEGKSTEQWLSFKLQVPENGKMIWWDDGVRDPFLVPAQDFSPEDLGHWMYPAPPKRYAESVHDEDVCGFCGEPGADKIPHPVRWPGEQSAGTELVHAACETAECGRAHTALSDKQREQFLRSV